MCVAVPGGFTATATPGRFLACARRRTAARALAVPSVSISIPGVPAGAPVQRGTQAALGMHGPRHMRRVGGLAIGVHAVRAAPGPGVHAPAVWRLMGGHAEPRWRPRTGVGDLQKQRGLYYSRRRRRDDMPRPQGVPAQMMLD